MNALPAELVQSFVGSSHGDLTTITEMLAEAPALANASWDWGGGDFETGLGAAAHMGRRDIAEVLLAAGARMDIFAAAMLGHLDVVKSIVEVDPRALTAPGPHGIPLLKHAEIGGERALDVLNFLKSLGPPTDAMTVPV